MADRVKRVQTETNQPPLEKSVRKWLAEGILEPTVDQPERAPNIFTKQDKLEAMCIDVPDRDHDGAAVVVA